MTGRSGNITTRIKYLQCPYYKKMTRKQQIEKGYCGRKDNTKNYYDCRHCILRKKKTI